MAFIIAFGDKPVAAYDRRRPHFIFIDNSRFNDLDILLSSKYFVTTKYRKYEGGLIFSDFRFHIQSLDQRNNRLSLRRLSVTADLFIQRSSLFNKSYKEKLLDTDILLHYISSFKFGEEHKTWFPTTYIYNEYSKSDLLRRLVSIRHFNKIKVLFGVKNITEMKVLVENFQNPYRGYNSGFESIPNIKEFINPEEIGTSA